MERTVSDSGAGCKRGLVLVSLACELSVLLTNELSGPGRAVKWRSGTRPRNGADDGTAGRDFESDGEEDRVDGGGRDCRGCGPDNATNPAAISTEVCNCGKTNVPDSFNQDNPAYRMPNRALNTQACPFHAGTGA